MRTLVFKTVRHDGSSIHVPKECGGRVYEIGKNYTFPEKFPTFVFALDYNYYNLEYIYDHRREARKGNRVLLCLTSSLKLIEAWGLAFWNYWPCEQHLGRFHVCHDLEVIGEIFPPKYDEEQEVDPPNPERARIALTHFAGVIRQHLA